jgi:hypothetical protein
VLCLGLSLVATATISRSVSLLVLSKADLERTRGDYALQGAQLQAAATVVRAGIAGPFHWTSSTDLGFVDVRAEREADKMSLTAAAGLPDQALAQFGVVDAAALRTRLVAAEELDVVDVSSLDAAALWRLCAPRAVSGMGQADAYAYAPDTDPTALGERPPHWRVGEVWRIRVSTPEGWRDERIVRFTGNAQLPAATILRTVARGDGEGGRCEGILQSIGAA